MVLSLGQGSGDFAETSGRVQPFHIGVRNSVGMLAPDAFTLAYPIVATGPSTTLTGVSQVGVLGGMVAFTRPDAGNGFIGGPKVALSAKIKPIGLLINDANGNGYENTPGVASNRAPYFSAMGCYGVALYETHNISTAVALVWSAGDVVYASKNGLLTNVSADNNTYEQAADGAKTIMGVVKVAPDADNSLLVVDLRV